MRVPTALTALSSPPAWPLIQLFDLPQRLIDTLSRRPWRELQTLFQDASIDKPKRNNFVDKSAIFLSTDDDFCDGKIMDLRECHGNDPGCAVDNARANLSRVDSLLPCIGETSQVWRDYLNVDVVFDVKIG